MEFIYSKDISDSNGLDAGWIDGIIFTQTSPTLEDIEILGATFEEITIRLRIDSSASEARIVKSYDGKIWEPTRTLSDGISDWFKKPQDGWDMINQVNISVDVQKNPSLLLRLEIK